LLKIARSIYFSLIFETKPHPLLLKSFFYFWEGDAQKNTENEMALGILARRAAEIETIW
jgi:hypothetical protein